MENTTNTLTSSEETALFLSTGFLFRTHGVESLARIHGMDQNIVNTWYTELTRILKPVSYGLISTTCNLILVVQKICLQAERSQDGKVCLDYQTTVHLSKLMKELVNGGGQHLVTQILDSLNWAWYQDLSDQSQQTD